MFGVCVCVFTCIGSVQFFWFCFWVVRFLLVWGGSGVLYWFGWSVCLVGSVFGLGPAGVGVCGGVFILSHSNIMPPPHSLPHTGGATPQGRVP